MDTIKIVKPDTDELEYSVANSNIIASRYKIRVTSLIFNHEKWNKTNFQNLKIRNSKTGTPAFFH